MSQPSLFDGFKPCLADETMAKVGSMRDAKAVTRLVSIVDRLWGSADPVEQARLAAEARDVAEAIFETSLREAKGAGVTWRELGAALDLPFQTLHRRYGG